MHVDARDANNDRIKNTQFGRIVGIDPVKRTVDIKKTQAMTNVHPSSIFEHDHVNKKTLDESLLRLASWVAEFGIDASGPSRAGRNLLLRRGLAVNFEAGRSPTADDSDAVSRARAIVSKLGGSALSIQGPPGAGKTFTASQMICDLVNDGKKVGITALSHKVIRNLLEAVTRRAAERGEPVRCLQKIANDENRVEGEIRECKDNEDVVASLGDNEVDVVGELPGCGQLRVLAHKVDVLFVDEAGQMSLVDVIAVSQCTEGLVLLGDPQQLSQPLQGSHPDGTDVSVLRHVLGDHDTLPDDLGIFLDQTWRLAPSICSFTSEIFYENKLKPRPGLERQRIAGPTRFAGDGLFYVPVNHQGNQNSSNEELESIRIIVRELLAPGVLWTNAIGIQHQLTLNDILIVAPYNAQVYDLQRGFPGTRVGTVDKFQGQQAPVIIYSMASSSPEDAPRGMDFLYSPNRFNVATSRAQCICILVASPQLFEADCHSPAEIKLANVLCRYLEMSRIVGVQIPPC